MKLTFGRTLPDVQKIVEIARWIADNGLADHCRVIHFDYSLRFSPMSYQRMGERDALDWWQSAHPATPSGYRFLREKDYIYARLRWG